MDASAVDGPLRAHVSTPLPFAERIPRQAKVNKLDVVISLKLNQLYCMDNVMEGQQLGGGEALQEEGGRTRQVHIGFPHSLCLRYLSSRGSIDNRYGRNNEGLLGLRVSLVAMLLPQSVLILCRIYR